MIYGLLTEFLTFSSQINKGYRPCKKLYLIITGYNTWSVCVRAQRSADSWSVCIILNVNGRLNAWSSLSVFIYGTCKRSSLFVTLRQARCTSASRTSTGNCMTRSSHVYQRKQREATSVFFSCTHHCCRNSAACTRACVSRTVRVWAKR